MAPRLRVDAPLHLLGATRVSLYVNRPNGDVEYASVLVDLEGPWAEDVLLDAVARLERRLGVEV